MILLKIAFDFHNKLFGVAWPYGHIASKTDSISPQEQMCVKSRFSIRLCFIWFCCLRWSIVVSSPVKTYRNKMSTGGGSSHVFVYCNYKQVCKHTETLRGGQRFFYRRSVTRSDGDLDVSFRRSKTCQSRADDLSSECASVSQRYCDQWSSKKQLELRIRVIISST